MNITGPDGKLIVEINYRGEHANLFYLEGVHNIKTNTMLPSDVVDAMRGEADTLRAALEEMAKERDDHKFGTERSSVVKELSEKRRSAKLISEYLDEIGEGQSPGKPLAEAVAETLARYLQLQTQVRKRKESDAEVSAEISDEMLGSGRGRLVETQNQLKEAEREVERLQVCVQERGMARNVAKVQTAELARLRDHSALLKGMLHRVIDRV